MTPLERVRALRPHFDEVPAYAGELLAVEGALCHQLFVVVEGTLETCRGGVRTELVAGQEFGWAAMNARGCYDASLRAVTDARLLVMSHAQFRAVRTLEIDSGVAAQRDGWRYRRGSWRRTTRMGRMPAS